MPDWLLFPQKASEPLPSWPAPAKNRLSSFRYLVASGATGAVVIVIAIVGTASIWSPDEWGSIWGAVGQWLGALGTFAAVVVALRLARAEARAAKKEASKRAESERAAAEQEAVRKASLVIAEVTQVPLALRTPNDPQWFVRIRNFGPDVVLLPRLEGFYPPFPGKLARWKFEDPSDPLWEDNHEATTALGPGAATPKLPVSVEYVGGPSTVTHPVPVFGYTDAVSGRRWRRAGVNRPQTASGNWEPAGPNWYRVPVV